MADAGFYSIVTRFVLKWLANRSEVSPPTEVAAVTNFVLVDFETAGPTNLKEAGAWRYSECPTTEILCLGNLEQYRFPRPGRQLSFRSS